MKYDMQFADALRAGFPAPAHGYYKRIDDTIALLQSRDEALTCVKSKHTAPFIKIVRIAAAACAAAVLLSACTFAVKPALAAELPLIGDAVYALSPMVSANEEKLNKVADMVKSAAANLAAGEYSAAESLFYQGDKWTEDSDTYLSAKYLHYVLHSAETFAGDGAAETVSFIVTDANAQRKAFRYEALIALELNGKGEVAQNELIRAELIETVHGLFITSLRAESDGYAEYAAMCNSYGLDGLQYENQVAGIAFETEYLSYMTVHKNAAIGTKEKALLLDKLRARLAEAKPSGRALQGIMLSLDAESAALEEQRAPAAMSAEELAAEVMYRYYMGQKLKEVQDFSDIMERNEATDLFFYDARLAVDKILNGVLSALDTVEKGTADLLETIQSGDGRMTARFNVNTKITSGPMRGVGEEIILTLEKRGAGWIVTGYDRVNGDGVYVNSLKPLAEHYKETGLSWQNANEKAYLDLLAEAGGLPASAYAEPLITVISNGEAIAPYENFLGASEWTDDGWLAADGIPAFFYDISELEPKLPAAVYGSDFAVELNTNASSYRLSIWDDTKQRIYHNVDISYIDALPRGTYYINIVVTKHGKYIESEKRYENCSIECIFKLIKNETIAAPKQAEMPAFTLSDIAQAQCLALPHGAAETLSMDETDSFVQAFRQARPISNGYGTSHPYCVIITFTNGAKLTVWGGGQNFCTMRAGQHAHQNIMGTALNEWFEGLGER